MAILSNLSSLKGRISGKFYLNDEFVADVKIRFENDAYRGKGIHVDNLPEGYHSDFYSKYQDICYDDDNNVVTIRGDSGTQKFMNGVYKVLLKL